MEEWDVGGIEPWNTQGTRNVNRAMEACSRGATLRVYVGDVMSHCLELGTQSDVMPIQGGKENGQ